MRMFERMAARAANDRPPTAEQAAFEAAVCALPQGGAMGLRARAGSGKTYSLVRACGAVQGRVLLLAFNAKVRDELRARAPAGTTVHTFHSFCNQIVGVAEPSPGVAKTYRVLKDPELGVKSTKSRWPIAQAISLAKNLCVGVDTPDTYDTWAGIFSDYDIRLSKTCALAPTIREARRVFDIVTSDRSRVDFDDMLYFVAKDGLGSARAWDYVFVDEAQDTNPAQLAVLNHLMSNGKTRLVFVGDDQQAIYGWRGAGTRSFDLMVEKYGAGVLPLTTTWRCANAVVRQAQLVVPDIRARPDADEGVVDSIDALPDDLGAGDAVLCRTNTPLLRLALDYARAGRPVTLLGRDMATAISGRMKDAFYYKPVGDRYAFSHLLDKARKDYEDRPFSLAQAVDEIESAKAMYDYLWDLGDVGGDLEGLLTAVAVTCGRLFSDTVMPDRVCLTTVHRAKGLEWDHVYVLHLANLPSDNAIRRGGWQLAQEKNLLYVAVTRAKHHLTYVGCDTDGLERAILRAGVA